MTNTEWQLDQLHQIKQFGERVSRFDGEELLIVSVDDDFCSMLGYSRAELLIRCCGKVGELIYTQDREETCHRILQDIRKKGYYTCEYRMQKKDGFLICVFENGICDTDERGNEIIRSLVVDVSQEVEIRKKRDTTYDNIPGGVMMVRATDHNFCITEANHQYFAMFGTTKEQYLGSSGVYTFFQDLPGLRHHIVEQAKRHEPIEYDFRTRHPEFQDIRWYRMLGRHYQDVEEGCDYLCILLDVTEQKRSLFQLEREKERYRVASGIRAHILFEYDMEKKQMQLYEDSQKMNFSLCIDNPQKGTISEIMWDSKLLYPEDEGALDPLFQEEEISASAQLRLLTKNRKTGERGYQWYEYTATKVMEQGRVTRIIGSFKNIEEQKKKEEEQTEIRTIFEIQSNKIYELVLQIKISSREVKGYFTDQTAFTDIFPSPSYDEFIRKMAIKNVHPEEREQFLTIFDLENMIEILDSSSLEEVLFFRIRRSGETEYRYKSFRFSYLGNTSGIIVVTTQDMHEMRMVQLKREDADRRVMAAALKEAKGMIEIRRNFLAILAREVKGPVQFIHSSLRKPEITDRELAELQYASHYILEIIQNMTEYERVDQGKVRVENQSFSMESTMQNLVDLWTSRLERAGMMLDYSFHFPWDEYYGDEIHFRQIVDNIMGNCLMNSEEGSKLKLWGNVDERNQHICFLSLVFEDRGVPIESEYFGRKYPLDRVNMRVDWKRAEGTYCTTFSLVLARRLAEMLGGRLELDRRQSVNVIKLTLPFQRGEREGAGSVILQEEILSREAALDQYRILVVERKDASSDLVGARLKVNGAKVDVAYTGKEGLERWKSYAARPFDAILVEGYLPDMDYIAFARAFRQQKETRFVPVIVMVDDMRQENICTSMEEGINAFLEKPLDIRRLQQLLDIYYR